MAPGIGKVILTALSKLQDLQENVERTTERAAHQCGDAKKHFEALQAHQEAVVKAASVDLEGYPRAHSSAGQCREAFPKRPIMTPHESYSDNITAPTLPAVLKSSSSPHPERSAQSAQHPLLVSENKTTEDTEACKTKKQVRLLKGRANDYLKVLWNWGGDATNRLSVYGSAVKHPNDHWYIFECRICHGNYPNNSTSRDVFLNGIKAFYVHLRQAHGMNLGEDDEAFIEHCEVCEVTEREYEQLIRRSDDAMETDKKLANKKLAKLAIVLKKAAVEKAEVVAARAQHDRTERKSGANKRKVPNTWDHSRGQHAIYYSYSDLGGEGDGKKNIAAYTTSPKNARVANKGDVITVSDDDEGGRDEAFGTVSPFDKPTNLVSGKTPKKTKGHQLNPTNEDDDIDGEVRISSPYFRKTAPRPASILASTPANTDRSLETLRC
ncbi:hypothetical protein LTR86_008398 [Recurvomyces mirabilis]|nr:hypothetical protein LTR86_008398 [Recurvomyces mirabilis]